MFLTALCLLNYAFGGNYAFCRLNLSKLACVGDGMLQAALLANWIPAWGNPCYLSALLGGIHLKSIS